jgi:hypothetical protein
LNNLTTKINNYQTTYNVNGGGTTSTTELEAIQTELATANTDMQGIDDAIRNFNATKFTKIPAILSSLNTTRNTLNQVQVDLMNTNVNLSSVRTRVNTQIKSRIISMKQDVYRVQQDVMTFATNQLSTLKTLVNNSVDVVRNQYSGQVDTHNSDINDIRSDFNNNTYIRDAANQNDWATRIVTLMDSIEATRVNVQTAINNNK